MCWYFGSEALEVDGSYEEKEIRYLSLLRYVLMRGDSYHEHHYDLVGGLFCSCDPFLVEHYGLATEEIISGIKAIVKQVEENLHRYMFGLRDNAIQLRTMFERHTEEHADSDTDLEDLRHEWAEQSDVQSKLQQFGETMAAFPSKVFAVEPTVDVPSSLLHLLSTSFVLTKSPGYSRPFHGALCPSASLCTPYRSAW